MHIAVVVVVVVVVNARLENGIVYRHTKPKYHPGLPSIVLAVRNTMISKIQATAMKEDWRIWIASLYFWRLLTPPNSKGIVAVLFLNVLG